MAEKIPNLTERSKARLAAGEVTGSGTGVCARCKGAKGETRVNYMLCVECQRVTGRMTDECRRCFGPKEDTRWKSDSCRACEGSRPERVAAGLWLDRDVMTRLEHDAEVAGVAVSTFIERLLVARDKKR